MRRFNPYTEQAEALAALARIDARSRIQEEYSAKWTAEKRKQAEKNGDAMPGGKYPIVDQEDLNNAAGLVGNGSADADAIKAHIRKQARKHGLTLPQSWPS